MKPRTKKLMVGFKALHGHLHGKRTMAREAKARHVLALKKLLGRKEASKLFR
jgi:hypothetical protein